MADTWDDRIRKIDTEGIITTVAGTGDEGVGGDGGPATEARLNKPRGVAVDADTGNNTVRKVDSGGTITTVAGGRDVRAGTGNEVSIARPRALAVGRSGSVFKADAWRERVPRLDDTGGVAVFVGLGRREVDVLRDVARDASGNIYVIVGGSHPVVKVDPSGLVMPFAGSGGSGYSGDGGPAVSAGLQFPFAVATDDMGNVYIADSGDHRIRMVDASGTISTVAGTGARGFSGDGGPATSAEFNSPAGVAAGSDGAVYVADRRNHRIFRIDSAGIVTTIAGNGQSGKIEPDIPAIRAPLRWPWNVDGDSAGSVYIPGRWSHRVIMVDNAGILRIAAGNGELGAGGDGGPATDAALRGPEDVAVSDTDTLYIVDSFSSLIRKVTSDGIITTIAGTGSGGYNGDGSPATDHHLRFPTRVAAYSDRRVLVADEFNHRIRVLTVDVRPPTISSVLNGAGYFVRPAPGIGRGGPRSRSFLPRVRSDRVAAVRPSADQSDRNVGDPDRIVQAGLNETAGRALFGLPDGNQVPCARGNGAGPGESDRAARWFPVQAGRVAPGLFSANGDDRGVAAASAVRIARDGTRTPLEVYRYDPEEGRYVAVPLDVRSSFSPVYLTLYGTGVLGGERPPASKLRGRHVSMQSAGPATGFPSLDKLVLGPVPRSIRNREVEVVAIVGGQMSNAVTIAFEQRGTAPTSAVPPVRHHLLRLAEPRAWARWSRPSADPARDSAAPAFFRRISRPEVLSRRHLPHPEVLQAIHPHV